MLLKSKCIDQAAVIDGFFVNDFQRFLTPSCYLMQLCWYLRDYLGKPNKSNENAPTRISNGLKCKQKLDFYGSRN